ncbi:tail fiber assembly protein [Providencia huaxiensis]|uniref:tail fiber assembly protein n=1 Tax=Providencia huaxiensis TaxID=2027290 RepID=UPI0034E4C4BE
MIYFKTKNSDVYAYQKADITQAERITELELLLREKEPAYIDASNNLAQAEVELEAAKAMLNEVAVVDENENNDSAKKSSELKLLVDNKTRQHEIALALFDKEKLTYQPIKDEYDEILPVFFSIREKLKVMKKMTIKEIDAHLNPPISKEQLIAEAEMQKQLCADDAEKNITMLERKVKLNMATDDDKNSLTAWEVYSIKVSDIDTSNAPDIEWPVKP